MYRYELSEDNDVISRDSIFCERIEILYYLSRKKDNQNEQNQEKDIHLNNDK